MWLWLIVLVVASSVAVLYRAACIIFPGVRTYILWGETSKWSHIADVCKNGQVGLSFQIWWVCKFLYFQYGDWFLLRQISKNVDQETFDEFLKQISKDIDPWDTPVSQSRLFFMDLTLKGFNLILLQNANLNAAPCVGWWMVQIKKLWLRLFYRKEQQEGLWDRAFNLWAMKSADNNFVILCRICHPIWQKSIHKTFCIINWQNIVLLFFQYVIKDSLVKNVKCLLGIPDWEIS